MIQTLILAFCAFFISIIGTKLVIVTIKDCAIPPDIDLLMEKKKPSPIKNGGIAMVFSLVSCLLATEINYMIILSVFMLTGLSLLGDIIKLSKSTNLLVRVFAVIITVYAFQGSIFTDIIPFFLDKILASVLCLLMIYSFEKSDKIEGLLPIEMIFIGLGLAALSVAIKIDTNVFAKNIYDNNFMQPLIFASVGLGFLWWNAYPAKVMAGKIGASAIGLIAGYLILSVAQKGYALPSLIIAAFFIIDNFLSFYFPKQKTTEKLAWIVRIIASCNFLLIIIAIFAVLNPQFIIMIFSFAYIMVFTLIYFLRKIRL